MSFHTLDKANASHYLGKPCSGWNTNTKCIRFGNYVDGGYRGIVYSLDIDTLSLVDPIKRVVHPLEILPVNRQLSDAVHKRYLDDGTLFIFNVNGVPWMIHDFGGVSRLPAANTLEGAIHLVRTFHYEANAT